jgi:hypothetical protein
MEGMKAFQEYVYRRTDKTFVENSPAERNAIVRK